MNTQKGLAGTSLLYVLVSESYIFQPERTVTSVTEKKVRYVRNILLMNRLTCRKTLRLILLQLNENIDKTFKAICWK